MPETINKERHTGFELLRIVSMIMIVLMHAIGHGGLGHSVSSNSLAYHVYWLIYDLSRVSTNCFVMLTGYFMSKSKMRPSRIFKIWCEVLVYSVLTYVISVAVGGAEISLSKVFKVFTPISSGGYWFATAYVFLCLAVPLLNRIINSIKTEKEFRRILFWMLLLTSVIPTILYWADPLYINGGYSFIWFAVLYFIAAYIRIYDIKANKKMLLGLYLGFGVIAPFMRAFAEVLQAKVGATTLVDNSMDYKMPITVIMSVSFFILFKNIEIKNRFIKKTVLAVAPFSFGVYLLHDGEHIRPILWKFINMTRFDGIFASVLYMIGVSLLIVVAGYCVNFVYQKLYALLGGKRLEKRIDKAAESINE